MPTSTDQIRARIESFLEEIHSLTRAAALEAVQSALNGRMTPSTPRGRRIARRATAKAPAVRSGKRAKRTTEDVAAVGAKIVSFVRSHPGCSVEQIREGLGLSKKDVALPIVRLRAERKLKTQGQKRGTKYFAGGAGARTAAKAKRVAQKAKKKRRAMSPEHKKALLAGLAKARAAKAGKGANG